MTNMEFLNKASLINCASGIHNITDCFRCFTSIEHEYYNLPYLVINHYKLIPYPLFSLSQFKTIEICLNKV